MDEANSLADQLRDKNVSLETRVGILEKELSACTQIQVSLEEKVKNLESDLKKSSAQLQNFSSGSEKLDNLLSLGKLSGDKKGLGYTEMGSSTSFTSSSPPVTKGKIVFVPSSVKGKKEEIKTSQVSKNKGKKPMVDAQIQISS